MKKILALILALLMLASVLVSCKKDETDNTGTANTNQVGETGRLAELGSRDFGGETFTVLDANDYPDMHVNYSTEETRNSSNITLALYERDIVLKELYNLNEIKYVSMTKAANGCDAIRTNVLAGDHVYDMVTSTAVGAGSIGTLATLAVQGMLRNLNEINYLSLDKEWWSPLIYENMLLNDKLFFTTGDINPSMYQAPAAMYVNMDLFNQYHDGTDIFKIVEDGEWTLEQLYTFSANISQDLNEDNIMNTNDDFFGIALTKTGLTMEEFVIGSGVTFSKVENNDLTMDLKSETLGNAIDTVKIFYPQLKYEYGGSGNDSERQQNVINVAFKNGKAVFLAHLLEAAMFHLRDMEGDYAVLPIPKADKTQENYLSLLNNWCDCFVSVPNSVPNDRLEFVGFMMEAMAAYSNENLRPFIYESVLKTQRVNDPQSSAMIDVIMDGVVIDYAIIYDVGGLSSMVVKAVLEDIPLSTQVITQKGAINKSIKDIKTAHGIAQ